MANKTGLDYFNIDVDFFNDPKTIKLSKRYGPVGVMCYLITLISIYQKGYFLEASIDDLAHIILNTINGKYVSGKYKLQEIILYLAEIDLIDKDLLEEHIITSRGIQKRFVLMTKNRKDQDYTKYWISKPVIKVTKDKAKEEPNTEEVDYQHLDKEQKKRIKRKEAIKKKINEQGPNKHYLTSCLISYKYIDEYDLDIYLYNQLFEELYQAYDQDTVFKAVRYLCNYASRKTVSIENKYQFFEKSIKDNLERLTKPIKDYSNQTIEEFMNDLIRS
jgi:hypothetical protein